MEEQQQRFAVEARQIEARGALPVAALALDEDADGSYEGVNGRRFCAFCDGMGMPGRGIAHLPDCRWFPFVQAAAAYRAAGEEHA